MQTVGARGEQSSLGERVKVLNNRSYPKVKFTHRERDWMPQDGLLGELGTKFQGGRGEELGL